MTTQADPSAIFVEYRPNPRRRTAVLAGLGAILLVFVTMYAVRWVFFRPAVVVDAYFDALGDRNMAAALRWTTSSNAGLVDRDLLGPTVLRSEDYLPPENVMITEATVTDHRATVDVEFTIGRTRHAASLQLHREGGFPEHLFHRWRVIDGLGWMDLGAVPEEIIVNGERIRTDDGQDAWVLPVVPGGYRVGVPESSLWRGSSAVVQVGLRQATVVEVPLTPKLSVRTEVDRQVTEHLDRCAASTRLEPADCPFGYRRASNVSDVEWIILSYPKYTLTVETLADRGSRDRLTVVLSTSHHGVAGISGAYRTFFDSENPFEDTVEFRVDGVVMSRGASVVVDFDP